MQINLSKTKLEFGFSFVFIITLMLIFFDEKIVLMSVTASMLHECGHLFMMRLCNERIEKVVFGAFGVRIEKYAFSGVSYKKEILIALGGIIVNLFLFCGSALIYCLTKNETAVIFGIINILIASMNAVPLRSLDMGRALNFMLLSKTDETKAEKISQAVSLIFCVAFIIFTVLYCVLVKVNFSLIAVSIYLLLDLRAF